MEQLTNTSYFTDIPHSLSYSGRMSSIQNRRKSDDGDYEYMAWGEALRYYRERAGLSQDQLGRQMGHTMHTTIATWEARAQPIKSDYKIERLATILHAPVDDLALGRVLKVREPVRTYREQKVPFCNIYPLTIKQDFRSTFFWHINLHKAGEPPCCNRAAL